MNGVNTVLARKLGLMPPEAEPAPPVEAPTPTRQMRRALARAADGAVGLSMSVSGISEEELEAEALIQSGPSGWVVIGLREGGSAGLTGLFLMDPALRSALVDMQTMGRLFAAEAEGEVRRVTRADTMLSIPFAQRLFVELDEVGFAASGLDMSAFEMGAMEDLRTAGLVMMQGLYRCWRIGVQIGDDLQGEMMIALRPKEAAHAAPAEKTSGWDAALRDALGDAPTHVRAVLGRLTLPMAQVERFEVDQLVPLAGTTVASVRLLGPSGKQVGTARLGQVAGKRAVRLEAETVELQENALASNARPLADHAVLEGGGEALPEGLITEGETSLAPLAGMDGVEADLSLEGPAMEIGDAVTAAGTNLPDIDVPDDLGDVAQEAPSGELREDAQSGPVPEEFDAGSDFDMPDGLAMDQITEDG